VVGAFLCFKCSAWLCWIGDFVCGKVSVCLVACMCALFLCVLRYMCVWFVVSVFLGIDSLYVAPQEVRMLAHGDERQVRWRIVSTGVTSLISPLVLLLFKGKERSLTGPGPSLLAWIGIRTEGLVLACLLPTAAMVGLFLGPLVDLFLQWKKEKNSKEIADFFPNMPYEPILQLRNLVIAPFAEELVFRACMGALLVSSGADKVSVIMFAPLFFGVAHFHHFIGMMNAGAPPERAALISLVQMTYTTLFGSLEMFIFLRTGHLASVFLAHSWCNLMGLPSFSFLDKGHINFKHRWFIMSAYVLGLSGFFVALPLATDPKLHKNGLFWD